MVLPSRLGETGRETVDFDLKVLMAFKRVTLDVMSQYFPLTLLLFSCSVSWQRTWSPASLLDIFLKLENTQYMINFINIATTVTVFLDSVNILWPAEHQSGAIVEHGVEERIDNICHGGEVPEEQSHSVIQGVEERLVEVIPRHCSLLTLGLQTPYHKQLTW